MEIPNVGPALGVALVGAAFVLIVLFVVGYALTNRH